MREGKIKALLNLRHDGTAAGRQSHIGEVEGYDRVAHGEPSLCGLDMHGIAPHICETLDALHIEHAPRLERDGDADRVRVPERPADIAVVIVAAGSRAVRLPSIPHDDPRVVDSTGALDLPEDSILLEGLDAVPGFSWGGWQTMPVDSGFVVRARIPLGA